MGQILGILASIRGYEIVPVDNSTVEAKRGELVGYDGFKHRKGTKIHACVNRDYMPLRIAVGPHQHIKP
jgi:hypothetical protein